MTLRELASRADANGFVLKVEIKPDETKQDSPSVTVEHTQTNDR